MEHTITVAELFDEIQGENGLKAENPEFIVIVEADDGPRIVKSIRWEHTSQTMVLELGEP